MSGSGVSGLSTSNITLLNPDTTQLNQVSVTPHFWVGNGTSTNTDTLDGLVRSSGHNYASSWNPSLSPSGRMVFVTNWFWSPGGGSYHLVAQNRDATDRIVIAGPFSTGSGASDRALRPSISPDGKNVIYTRSDGIVGQLYTVPSDGSEEPRLFEITMPEELSNRCNPDHVVQAVYSPDGSEMAFLGITTRSFGDDQEEAPAPAVCVMNADGTNLRVLYAEIQQLDYAIFCHKDIGWLQIAVDDQLLMCILYRLANLLKYPQAFIDVCFALLKYADAFPVRA